MRLGWCLVVALAACGGDDDGGFDSGVRDAAVGRDAGVSDGGGDGGRDASADGGAGDAGEDASVGDAGTDAGPPMIVRFFVLGDQGEGNAAQSEVAAVMQGLCETEGCDFAVLLGDNFYESGVESVTDPQWDTKFETPYADLDIPFFAVLGNHDYGGNLFGIEQGGLGNEFDKGPIEVMYTDHSDKWEMYGTHYTFRFGPVGFIMLDTNSILWDDTSNGDQDTWITTAFAEVAGSEWVFSAGHHPYRSQGRHGNAGTYESIEVGGVEVPLPVPIMDGREVKRFFEAHICGAVDMSFSGHDHNRQWLDEADRCGGTELLVSGAGAKTTDFVSARGNDLHFGNDTSEGIWYIIVDGATLTGRSYDRAGTMEYERTIVH